MILEAAIVSPYFLRFNPVLNAFEEAPFHAALSNLRAEIRRFNECNNSETMVVVYEHSQKQLPNRDDAVAIEPNKLGGLYHLYDRWVNIIELCKAIHRHLDGKPFVRAVTPLAFTRRGIDRADRGRVSDARRNGHVHQLRLRGQGANLGMTYGAIALLPRNALASAN
jgi:hypothetical protein